MRSHDESVTRTCSRRSTSRCKALAGRDRQTSAAALERNLAQRGLAHPGDPWLEAATSDLARGKLYVVNGPAMQDIGVRVHRGEPL